MNHYRYWLSYSGFNLNDASFQFVGSVFQTDPDHVIVIATKEKDNCTFERIEHQDKSSFKVFIKDITREDISQKVNFRFHLIYSSNGNLLRQTLNYNGKSDLNLPEEIEID